MRFASFAFAGGEMPQTGNTSSGSPSGRERQLNIIYFVDANKTRSIKLSISKAKLIGSLLVLTISWAFLATGILFYSSDRVDNLEVKLSQSLGVIFDYQVKYEDTYEKAYPFTPTKKAKAPPISVASNKAEPKKTTKSSNVAQTKPATALAAKLATPALDKPLVSIEEAKVDYENPELKVRFALRNNQSPKRATGYVFGTAKFVSDAGVTSFLVSPRGIKAGSDGAVANPKSGYAYRIRYYKAKTMSFQPPKGVAGKFVQVSLSLVGSDGQQSDKRLNVDIPVVLSEAPEKLVKVVETAQVESTVKSSDPVATGEAPVSANSEKAAEGEGSNAP